MPVAVASFNIKFIVDSEYALVSNAAEVHGSEVEGINQQIAAGVSSPVVAVVSTKEEIDARFTSLEQALSEKLTAELRRQILPMVDSLIEQKVRQLLPQIQLQLGKR